MFTFCDYTFYLSDVNQISRTVTSMVLLAVMRANGTLLMNAKIGGGSNAKVNTKHLVLCLQGFNFRLKNSEWSHCVLVRCCNCCWRIGTLLLVLLHVLLLLLQAQQEEVDYQKPKDLGRTQEGGSRDARSPNADPCH
jgi:hypothetical protein